MFFNRLINLSAVRVCPDPFRSWEQIQGANPRHMAAGHTPAKPPPTSAEDLLNRPHDAYKVISLNKEQDYFLSSDFFPFVVFINDFGSGKIRHSTNQVAFQLLYSQIKLKRCMCVIFK